MPGYMFPGVDSAPRIQNMPAIEQEQQKIPNSPGSIDAGLSYFGQLIAHDIAGSAAREIKRSVSLNLQCLYGDGYSYVRPLLDSAGRFILGRTTTINHASGPARDIPRGADGTPLVADARNDENLLISQLHMTLMRAHNYLLSRFTSEMEPAQVRFELARRWIILWYQTVIVEQFLSQILDENIYDHYFLQQNPNVFYCGASGEAPLEFTHAAFRFGHSMIRSDYAINGAQGHVLLNQIFSKVNSLGTADQPTLSQQDVVEWEFLFSFDDYVEVGNLNTANPIDLHLTGDMNAVPSGGAILGRNLLSGESAGLPSAQDILHYISEANPAEYSELGLEDSRLNSSPAFFAATGLSSHTPLWLYILSEANSQRLGKLGSVIVAEVIRAGLRRSPISIYSDQDRLILDSLVGCLTQFRRLKGRNSTHARLTLQDLVVTTDAPTKRRLGIMATYDEVKDWAIIGQVVNRDSGDSFEWQSEVPAVVATKENIERYHGAAGSRAQLALRYAAGYHLSLHCLEGWDRNVDSLVKPLEFYPADSETLVASKPPQPADPSKVGLVEIIKFTFAGDPKATPAKFVGTIEWSEVATGEVFSTSWDWVD